MSESDNIISAQRAVLWEEAKGKLRALCATSGLGHERVWSYDEKQERFEALRKKVEDFITEMEDEGLQE